MLADLDQCLNGRRMLSGAVDAGTATAMLQQSTDLSSQWQERNKFILDTIQKTLNTAVEHDPPSGVYRVSQDIFMSSLAT